MAIVDARKMKAEPNADPSEEPTKCLLSFKHEIRIHWQVLSYEAHLHRLREPRYDVMMRFHDRIRLSHSRRVTDTTLPPALCPVLGPHILFPSRPRLVMQICVHILLLSLLI